MEDTSLRRETISQGFSFVRIAKWEGSAYDMESETLSRFFSLARRSAVDSSLIANGSDFFGGSSAAAIKAKCSENS